jgi:Cu-processing system permease protein
MNKITKYVLYDIVRNRFVLGYTALLLAITLSFFGFESDSNKGLLSLLNIILMVVPLVSIIFSTIHFYNSYEFIELLLAQPLSRQRIFLSEYAGVAASLSLAFLVGVGVPTVLFDGSQRGAVLIISGLLLTLTFVSLAFLAAVVTRDKAKGIGLALVLWFYFALVYDGLVLGILFSFSDYPLEKPMLLLTALNPTDLARVMVLMKMDISALMGFTGAVFQDFFSTQYGLLVALAVLLVWVAWPVAVATRIFSKKDL